MGRIAACSIVLLSAGAPPCQEINPAFDASGATTGTESSGGPVPVTTSTTTTTTTSSTGSGGDDTTAVDGEGDSTTTATNTTGGDDPSPSESSTGEPPLAYPPCDFEMDPVCPPPYDECFDVFGPNFNVCTQACQNAGDCPAPTSGSAEVLCAGPSGDQCVLDCSNGQCPDGMECRGIGPGGNIQRCAWPV